MYFLWIDCEMTGLEYAHDQILEIACIATSLKNTSIGLFTYHAVFRHKQSTIDSMNNICYSMHKQSGLVERVLCSQINYKHAENQILLLINKNISEGALVYIAGNSVYTDLLFIRKYLPRLFARLHYRTFDISTLKLCAEIKNIEPFQKEKKHEAIADIYESIAEYEYYKKVLLK